MKAAWNSALIAQSDDITVVEGNVCFPEGSVERSCV
jgi:hypothetical protein